jgi:hypothetical protein
LKIKDRICACIYYFKVDSLADGKFQLPSIEARIL